MTPNEIATNVSGIAGGTGNITASTSFTQSPAIGGGFTTDDANTWD